MEKKIIWCVTDKEDNLLFRSVNKFKAYIFYKDHGGSDSGLSFFSDTIYVKQYSLLFLRNLV